MMADPSELLSESDEASESSDEEPDIDSDRRDLEQTCSDFFDNIRWDDSNFTEDSKYSNQEGNQEEDKVSASIRLSSCSELGKKLSPEYRNIMKEFAEVETFLISMDSLVVELAAYGCLSWELGGSMQPVVSMAESFFGSLRAKGGIFKLVWFSDLQSVFKLSPPLLLLRTVVKKQFESSEYSSEVFPNPLDPFYRQLVKELCPSFLMMATNSHPLIPSDNLQFQECFSSLVFLTLLRDSTSVVLFPGMVVGISSIRAFTLGPIQTRKMFQTSSHHISNSVQASWKSIRMVGSHLSSYALTSIGDISNECATLPKFFVRVILEVKREPKCELSQSAFQVLLLAACLSQTFDVPNQTAAPSNTGYCSAQILKHLDVIQSTVAFLLVEESCSNFDLPIIFNGPLILAVANFCDEKIANGESNIVPEIVLEEFQQCCIELDMETADIWTKAVKKSIPGKNEEVDPSPQIGLQRIDHPLLSYFAGSLNQLIGNGYEMESLLDMSRENSFWDTSKSVEIDLGDIKFKTSSERKRELRARQKYIEWVKFYGETLEGRDSHLVVDFSQSLSSAQGKNDNSEKSSCRSSRTASPHGGKKRNVSKSSRKEDIISKNLQSKKIETQKKLEAVLSHHEQSLSELQSLLSNPKYASNECQATICYQIFLALKVLHDALQTSDSSHGKQELLVDLAKASRQLSDPLLSQHLTATQRASIEDLWNSIQFDDESGEAKKISSCLAEFLLRNGNLIDVQLKPTKDNRVPGFVPDSWQREMLDVVDSRGSALIVAPTSAGKTFVSYYCMETVLREGDEGVVVYVAPTKALVNQVAATVYARFRNKTFHKPGRTLFGVFLKEYHHNVLSSQILITVPEGLEILLMRTDNDGWKKRLRFAIFDEVHCIGDGIGDVRGADVLEHALLLVPCPFLALSATIGSPVVLQEWLTKIEHKKGRDRVRHIQHEERNSELEIILYNFHKGSVASKTSTSVLHPFVVFTPEKLKTCGFPEDLHLTAAQILDLYETISKTEPKLRDSLAPNALFSDCSLNNWLNRSDLRKFEAKLKALLLNESEGGRSPAFVETILGNLRESTSAELSFRSLTRDFEAFSLERICDLILHLKKHGMLPALCFSDNRKLCVVFAMKVFNLLCQREKEFLNRPSSKATVLRFKKDSEKHRKTKEFEEKVKKRISDKKKEELMRQCMFIGDNALDLRSANYFGNQLDEFSLAKPKADPALLERVIDRLYERDSGKQLNTFAHMLRRGIGCHHPGMSTVKRQAVEILFRSGHLGMVFSTSTLALGIHMPCRTVIFATDSPDLTPLQFRQMSGRAGRRGFDEKGSVILFGLPKNKVARLLTATLPKLRGNIPFTPSFVLKLLKMTNRQKNDHSDQIKLVSGLLEDPLIIHEGWTAEETEEKRRQLQFYFIYSVYFLRRCGLIDSKGRPGGLHNLIDAVPCRGPGMIMFARLVGSGIIRQVLSEKKDTEGRQELVIVLVSHLFTQEPLLYSPSDSDKCLPPLPEKIAEAIDRHNDEAMKLFHCLATTLASESPVSAEEKVESNYMDSTTENTDSLKKPQKITELEAHLSNGKSEHCRNIFGNNVHSMPEQMLKSCFAYPFDHDVLYDEDLLPARMYPRTDYRGNRFPLSSYALDFFRHGSFKMLLFKNGLSEGKAYSLLNDFDRSLQALTDALTSVSRKDEDEVVAAFQQTYLIFHEYFQKLNKKSKN